MSRLSGRLKNVRWQLRQKYVDNFIFIHVPKTAGTSVVRTLGIPRIHETASDIRNRLGARRWEGKFKFAFVRNPWDRAVSLFHFAAGPSRGLCNSRYIALSFREWLKFAYVDRHPLYFDFPHSFGPQLEWISDLDGNVIVDFVGRFENLRQDFATICARLGLSTAVLPHYGASKHDDYRSYYKDEDVDIIAKWYKKDIEHFGYAFEPTDRQPEEAWHAYIDMHERRAAV